MWRCPSGRLQSALAACARVLLSKCEKLRRHGELSWFPSPETELLQLVNTGVFPIVKHVEQYEK